jgi:hypothetical protein
MASVRTRFITNDIDKCSPKLWKLRKFASMGSALTFPVQSIVFLCLALAVGCYQEQVPYYRVRSLRKKVRVYGDDIIIPAGWVPQFRAVLTALGLKINEAKTFTGKNFRESCGVDAFRGANVTPANVIQFYEESKPTSLRSVVEISNNFYLRGYFAASLRILSSVPKDVLKYVPWTKPGSRTFGRISGSGFVPTSKVRWNVNTQVEEFLMLDVISSQPADGQRYEGFANLLQYFTEDPSKSDISVWASGQLAKPLPLIRKRWVSTLYA